VIDITVQNPPGAGVIVDGTAVLVDGAAVEAMDDRSEAGVVVIVVADRMRLVVAGAGVVVVGTGVLVVGATVEAMDGRASDRAPKT